MINNLFAAASLKTALLIVLAIAVLLIVRSLLVRSRLVESRIDLDDLLLGDDGKMSKAAAVMLGAFLVTSWMMVYLTLTGKLTEGYFAAYLAAWVAPTVTRLIVGNKQAAP